MGGEAGRGRVTDSGTPDSVIEWGQRRMAFGAPIIIHCGFGCRNVGPYVYIYVRVWSYINVAKAYNTDEFDRFVGRILMWFYVTQQAYFIALTSKRDRYISICNVRTSISQYYL